MKLFEKNTPSSATRFTILFLIISFIGFTTKMTAQKVSISAQNTKVENILESITRQTGLNIAYSRQIVNLDRRLDINLTDAELNVVLEKVIAGTKLGYEVKNGKIYLFEKDSKGIEQSTQQKITVSGTVVDNFGDPVIGANVVEKGTVNGTTTDLDGNFFLSIAENATLDISYIGYMPQNVPVDGKTSIKITLFEDSQQLEEVVVVGYGVQKKRDLTGAISSVKMDDTPVGTFSSISHALSGKAAGLHVVQNSAQVGGGTTFRIRGATSINASNDPLFIIDGFPVSSSGDLSSGNRYDSGSTDNILGSINPNDIESIEVLKDASATAIYGSRAGNGVIIITTKRGKKMKPQVSYSGNFSVQNMKNGYKMLNAPEYMRQRNHDDYEKWMKTNGQGVYADYITPNPSPAAFKPRYTDEEIAAAKTTDWFDEVTRGGIMHSHNVSLMGGSETTQYLASVNYFSQKGIVKNNNMDRFTMKVNLDQEISNYVKAGFSFHLSRNNLDNVALGSDEWENSGVLSSALRFDPSVPVYNSNGEYSKFPDMGQYPNPVSLLDIKDKTIKDRILASSYIQVEPVKGLILKSTLGFDRRYDKRKNYIPNSTMYGASVGGNANIYQRDNNDYLFDATATYMKDFGNHSLTALVGYSYQQFNTERMNAGNTDFPTDGFIYNNLEAGAGAKPTVGSSANKNALGSYFGRINYSYLGKYLLTATFRADGESNFDPDHRWGYFPSFSAGWRFSDEKFMESISHILSNGKLRASYGQTGNSSVGYRILDYYGVGNSYVFGNAGYVGTATQAIGNRKLTWETTTEFNLGLDLGFINNRITFSMEYYNRVISNLLVTDKKLPSYNEIKQIAANIGKTQGKGFEFTLNTVNVTNKNFEWTTDVTVYTYRDRWKERDPKWTPAAYHSIDDPIRAIYVYASDGILQAGESAPAWQPALVPGQIKLKNLKDEESKMNVLDQYDRILLGSRDPEFNFGFNNSFRYKHFDMNIYLYGEVGRWRGPSYYDRWTAGYTGNPINPSRQTLNAWAHDNTNAKVPSVIQSSYEAGDFYYKKINYLRCRNITLGYNIPNTQKFIKNIRLSATVNNPFTFTNWSGVDPETELDASSSKEGDTKAYAYPNVTTFSFGVDITF
ncbi:MAG: TonB-dependent receptor [Tannerellaceae bacterium]|jgi:TonB-linked SusC/RagA family outer membrane protein|nr:TonB-dependent receptor [Tannerellaceae bacterium]